MVIWDPKDFFDPKSQSKPDNLIYPPFNKTIQTVENDKTALMFLTEMQNESEIRQTFFQVKYLVCSEKFLFKRNVK